MKISKEIKAALIVISGIVMFFFGINFLMSNSIFSNNKKLYAVFNHSMGLQKAAPVSVNGHQIGQVKDIQLRNSDNKIVVLFEIENNDFEFSKNSLAEIYANPLSGTILQLVPANDGAENAKTGDTLKSAVNEGLMGKLGTVEEQVESVLKNVDTLIGNINNVLDKERRESLKKSITDLNGVVVGFKGASEQLNGLIAENRGKLGSSIDNLEGITQNFESLSDSLNQADIKGTLKKFDNAMAKLEGLMIAIENGEGTLGKFMKDEQLYDNLEGATGELEQLLEDLKLHPKRYVHFSLFGKKNKEYKAPEE